MTVAGVFPTVARDFVGTPDPTSRKHDCFGAENFEAPALAFVAKRANGAAIFLQDRQNHVLHEHVDALMHTVILQSANHLKTGAIAHVGEPWIFVTAKVSLQNASVLRAIENCAPR